MAKHRTYNYDDSEVQQLMKEKNITESVAKNIIYHREYHKKWYEEHQDERKQYYKDYRRGILMANHRTYNYDDSEVQQLMKEKNIAETTARSIIYHREYYKKWYEEHQDERKQYYKEYRCSRKEK